MDPTVYQAPPLEVDKDEMMNLTTNEPCNRACSKHAILATSPNIAAYPPDVMKRVMQKLVY